MNCVHGHGHIYGHGHGHSHRKLQRWSVVSGQYLGQTELYGQAVSGQWSVYSKFGYYGQGQRSEVRETDRTTLENIENRSRAMEATLVQSTDMNLAHNHTKLQKNI